MQDFSRIQRTMGNRIGFVPTMGALHKGHLSLLKYAQQVSDVSVMSIFVNPTQFGPAEDFSKYPRPFDADCERAKSNGCQALFAPTPATMYPKDYVTYVNVRTITEPLCGAIRPGHFEGVTTIVLKLFNCVMPHIAIFGQKDAQQCIVIKRMVLDLNMDMHIAIAPTLRESDGVAMSSRNSYLTPLERSQAISLSKGLGMAQDLFCKGVVQTGELLTVITQQINQATELHIEYVEAVSTLSLEKTDIIAGPTLFACAVRTKTSGTRLIDNCIIGGSL